MKTLLIIGASSDIGCEFLKKNADDYDCIWAHYFHWNHHLEEIKTLYSDRIIFLCADLSKEQELNALIEHIIHDGRLPNYILHIPMTKIVIRKFQKDSWMDYEAAINVSLRSAVGVSKAFLPYFKKQKYGKTVFILSSVTIGIPPKYESVYVTVKYAMLGLMKSLAAEYGGKGICINGISPDMIQTKFISELPALLIENYSKTKTNGNILSVDEIIPVIEFLVSNKSDTINGENIYIG